jgi:hypothetical protein
VHIPPSIIFFTFFGIVLIVRGFRGRAITCDPVCANCGYDLRGYSVMTRCSECGHDLTVTGAVQRNARRASRRKILGGVGLMALPWAFVGVMMFMDSLGPHWERLRSNSSIIASLGTSEDTGPWLWNELARRVKSGRLKNPEAAAAVDKFIATQLPGNQPLVWSGEFFTTARRAGVITGPQYLTIAQKFFGKAPRIIWPSSISSENPTQLTIMPATFWSLPGVHVVFTLQQISMSGPSATDEDVLNRPGQGSMPPPDINLMSPMPFMTSAPMVPSGHYTAKFIIRTDLLAGNGQAATVSNVPPTIQSLAQWTETVTMPVDVYRNQYSANPKALTLRTDADADPAMAGAISVKSAVALIYLDKTIIVITLKIHQLAKANGLEQIWGHSTVFKAVQLNREYFKFDSTGRPHELPNAGARSKP